MERESGSSTFSDKLSGSIVAGKESGNAASLPKESGGRESSPRGASLPSAVATSGKVGAEEKEESEAKASESLGVSWGKTASEEEAEGRRIVHPPPKIRKKSSKKAVILLLHTKCSVLILRWRALLS